ncbi:transcription initiation factor TFIID subunit 12-like [Lytechinus variegatus]|uniref:transcription initiation factor TFIID subunit 12-like n=1 Tax=Lytechinus variegatus TaxID=7654 RepID=UPI001BB1EE00|nr:transcription initiation factor TFIID subunit 12-like [Lytechinus variegatus]XP_041462246.1 transcription initiation factor TFIID subunit 12-like [Lytechinus variegatus]XP_041462341.1 transcription initiation factor TFIID subunit 12-like [Lytechinus variegatus]
MNPQTSTNQSVPPLVPITSGSAVQGSGGGGVPKAAVPCKTLQETIKAIETQINIMEKIGQLSSKQEGDLTKLRELHQKALQEQERLRVEKMHGNMAPIHQQPNSATQAIKSIASSSNNNSNVQLGASSSSSSSSHSLQHSSSSIRDTPRESPISMSIGAGGDTGDSSKILNKKKIQDLVREVDPNTQLDEDVEEMLLQIADDFIENIVTAGCQLAKHRKSSTLEVKDILMHLERNWNMWIPGYAPDEAPKAHKRPASTEAHKQRMALIRKTLKK